MIGELTGAQDERLAADVLERHTGEDVLPLLGVGVTVDGVLGLHARRHDRAPDHRLLGVLVLVGDEPADIHLVPSPLFLERAIGPDLVSLDLEMALFGFAHLSVSLIRGFNDIGGSASRAGGGACGAWFGCLGWRDRRDGFLDFAFVRLACRDFALPTL